jgi:hypothetical protein
MGDNLLLRGYKTMDSALPETALPEGQTKQHFPNYKSWDTTECLDFLTCVCVFLPLQSVVLEDVELPNAKTWSSSTKAASDDSTEALLQTHKVDVFDRHACHEGAYDLTPLVDGPPVHYATTARHYGMCPLGHQETILF